MMIAHSDQRSNLNRPWLTEVFIMQTHRYKVFGRILDIQRQGSGWRCLQVANDGKRLPAAIVIPDFIEEAELAQYLFDVFHEEARPGQPDVVKIK